MARTTTWRRAAETYVNDAGNLVSHTTNICPLFPGETLTRVRFQYWAGSYQGDFPFLNDGITCAMSLQVYPTEAFPINRFPVTHPDDDWLWWETFTFKTDVFWIEAGDEISEARGPLDGGYRDCKAQRGPIPPGEAHFLVIQTQSTLSTQGAHYLSYGASALVLDPAP
uniref:Uncharacterized protein n=1 Tax=uncultured prokaryote TaxID=198431 RepID=A0A0H5Q5K3_9ZZZZ|nr:hypothetical protein [uncultured prokaryote]